MIPMRDGVQLATDIYRPADNKARPVLLYRTPYNKNKDHLDAASITLMQLLGYAYVVQDTRGRFASQGTDSAYFNDGWGALQDGYDTIDWLVRRPWCNGKIGQFGASASGITTYRAAGAAHPSLICAVSMIAASDFYHQVVYPGGELQKSRVEEWINGQNSQHMLPFLLSMPYYNRYWEEMNLLTRVDQITTAILHIGGWYDCFSEGTLQAYSTLKSQSLAYPQKLLMGPWTHTGIGETRAGTLTYPGAALDFLPAAVQWFDYWLKGADNGAVSSSTALYYLMGDPDRTDEIGCQWIEADTWPPQSQMVPYYLSAEGALNEATPDISTSYSYPFDPGNPVPTIGGNNQKTASISDGPHDQRSLNQRADILAFASAPLIQPLRVEGTVKGILFVSTDRPDTDFTLKLIDVYPDGREMIVCDGIRRIRFRDGYTAEKEQFAQSRDTLSVEITLPPTAIVFNSGHRIKVAVSSSNFPRYEINPNTGAEPNHRLNPLTAINTVHIGARWSSHIILPVVRDASRVSRFALDVLPENLHLYQNYPNPFNQHTIIRFKLDRTGQVSLRIIDLKGRLVKSLEMGIYPTGTHTLFWDGRDQWGQPVPSGIFWYVLQAGQTSRIRKLSVLR